MANLHVRVVVEHSPAHYEILGLMLESDCPPSLRIAGHDVTFYRSQSTPRWVLYKQAVKGWGERKTLDPRQQ